MRLLADAKDPERADLLEEQVLQIVDNLYQMWEQKDRLLKNLYFFINKPIFCIIYK